jgi:hypothetical protein
MFTKETGLQFSFLDVSLSGFGMNVTLASQIELGSVPFLFHGKFKECWYWFFLKGLVEFSRESVRSWTFLFGRLFIAASISLNV